jgi:hypothetical protein
MHRRYYDEEAEPSSSDAPYDIAFNADGMQPATDGASARSTHENAAPQHDGVLEIDLEPTIRTRLLNQQNLDFGYSSRPGVHRNYGSFAGSIHSDNSFGESFPGITETVEGDAPDATHALLGDAVADGILSSSNGQKKSTTKWLADHHGVKNQRMMYVAYSWARYQC